MTTTWRRMLVGSGLGLYLLGLGFLGGVVAERVRFDHQRTAVLKRYNETLQRWKASLMALEHDALAERRGVPITPSPNRP